MRGPYCNRKNIRWGRGREKKNRDRKGETANKFDPEVQRD